MKSDLHTIQTFDKIFFSDFSTIENNEMKALSTNSFLRITSPSGKVINLICDSWNDSTRVIIGSCWIMYGASWTKTDIDQFK